MDSARKIKLALVAVIFALSAYFYKSVYFQAAEPEYSYGTGLFFITALCFGVIFTAAVYNLALARYMKSQEHLFYAAAQFFTLLFLAHLDSLNIKPFDTLFGFKSLFWFDLSQLLMLFFTMLFIKAFLYHYLHETLDGLINAVLYAIVADTIMTLIFGRAFLFKLIPVFVPIWLILSEANRLCPKERKDIAFYYLLYGWGVVLLIVALEYIGFVDFTGWVFPWLHVALAIDAIVLSLALSYKFKLREDDRRRQQSILLQRSRLASMGEMIATVAHQWRQPLTYLSFAFMNINKQCTAAEAKETIEEAQKQLQYMSRTIENFRHFYNPSKERQNFSVAEACRSVLRLIEASVPYIQLHITEDFTLFGNQNEFEQALLNLINNAKEVLEARNITDPKITVVIDTQTVTVTDNGGGIDPKIIHEIFKPYFTTKEENDGIGLYIAQTVVEKAFKGKLRVTNSTEGAQFSMAFPKTATSYS